MHILLACSSVSWLKKEIRFPLRERLPSPVPLPCLVPSREEPRLSVPTPTVSPVIMAVCAGAQSPAPFCRGRRQTALLAPLELQDADHPTPSALLDTFQSQWHKTKSCDLSTYIYVFIDQKTTCHVGRVVV